MICPLKFTALGDSGVMGEDISPENKLFKCEENKCAWWLGKKEQAYCSIKWIAKEAIKDK